MTCTLQIRIGLILIMMKFPRLIGIVRKGMTQTRHQSLRLREKIDITRETMMTMTMQRTKMETKHISTNSEQLEILRK